MIDMSAVKIGNDVKLREGSIATLITTYREENGVMYVLLTGPYIANRVVRKDGRHQHNAALDKYLRDSPYDVIEIL